MGRQDVQPPNQSLATGSAADTGSHGQRRIGFWTCTALVVGNIIGMGIFLLPASLAPYGLNALIAWGVTLVGCLAIARIFMQLSRALPDADGPYAYVQRSLGEVTAYVALWAYWASIWPTDAALATGVVGYLREVLPVTQSVPPSMLALGLLWAVVLVNMLGVRTGGIVQIVTTVLKLLPLLVVVLLGGWVLVHSPGSYVAHLPTTPIGVAPVMAASTLALFAMIGIESAAMPAARVRDPGRTIPRATMAGTVLTVLVYIVVSAVPLLLIPQHALADASAPFSLVVEQFLGHDFGRWIGLFVVVSGLGALNGWTLLVGELTRTMADNGVMPKMLGRGNRFGAPVGALLVIGVFSSLMIVMSYSRSLVGAFTFLTRVVTAANLPLYFCCALALLVFWWRGKIKGSVFAVVPVAVIALLYVGIALVGAGAEPTLLMLGLCAAGLPLYAFMRLRRR